MVGAGAVMCDFKTRFMRPYPFCFNITLGQICLGRLRLGGKLNMNFQMLHCHLYNLSAEETLNHTLRTFLFFSRRFFPFLLNSTLCGASFFWPA